jgi:hypothetical protein
MSAGRSAACAAGAHTAPTACKRASSIAKHQQCSRCWHRRGKLQERIAGSACMMRCSTYAPWRVLSAPAS